ncbi:hypothetical protein [Pluralibacter gergoviae]|uniref:hypothetical protein n=1 Tax=Pluralibacter gergoviae TaxID=61647 RepID=UPI0006AC14DF|nr:hypothetical protein [Pluralibacter gergoviae]KOQ93303.1 hypothetical protein ABW48_19865 [Pluralibacter gergoviae]
MEKFMGTPGPWFVVDDHPQRACFDIESAENGSVYASVYTVKDEAIQDAQLISAAPELLEALQELVFLYEYDEGCRELTEYKRAKAAINKAIGKE